MLAEVRLAVEDWRPMRRACLDAIADLAPSHSPNLAEYDDFLRWLEANHFTFLGHRRYRYVDDAAQPGGLRYELMPGSALGILRRDEVRLFESGLGGGEAMARFARGPQQHPDRQDRPPVAGPPHRADGLRDRARPTTPTAG